SYLGPPEGEVSYRENALLKARALAAQLQDAGIRDAAVIGDDSGIEVQALGGVPGVLSARYGGPDLSWPDRRNLLLREARSASSGVLAARFVCAIAYVDSEGTEFAVQGSVEGQLVDERGEGGFSYDPIFWYPPLQRTFAELSEKEKNAVSHRAMAVRSLIRLRPSLKK
ncbi:MAG: non-canonical purine NTP pyrophosphatase, partial [Candidatus Eremiobacteraeota bacterium]|nr:non-canonical purine NTP pyrophosphatase [Candidatus Eremiobacteraeota bacterium]